MTYPEGTVLLELNGDSAVDRKPRAVIVTDPSVAKAHGFDFAGYANYAWGWWCELGGTEKRTWTIYNSGSCLTPQGTWPADKYRLHPDPDEVIRDFTIWRLTQ